jgi:hypothetical protein
MVLSFQNQVLVNMIRQVTRRSETCAGSRVTTVGRELEAENNANASFIVSGTRVLSLCSLR